jgi:gas vesicle protein
MADQQLNIRLNVIDNASKAFDSLKGSIFSIKSALIGLGTGVALKSLVNIGIKAEDAKARLASLTGTTVLGGRAFDQFTKFAIGARVPLEEVIASSKKLVALGSSPERLAKNLEIISNISAQTGLGFETTVDQFSKATTKGLNNARLFADENIRILLGIPKGLEVGGKDALKFFEREFSGSGRFGKANENLKAGVSGSIIALRNILFSFASQVSVGFFNVLKKQLGDLELFFKQNKTSINEFATTLGNVLGQALIVVGKALKIFIDNIKLFLAIFVGTQIFKAIEAIRKLAIAIGLLNVAFLTPIGAVLGVIAGAILLVATNADKASKGLENFKKKLKEIQDTSDPSQFNEVSEGLENILGNGTEPIKESMKEINSSFEDFLETGGTPLGETDTFLERVLDKFKDLNDISKDIAVSVAEGMNRAIDGFSKGIAESIVLGKSLQGTLKGVAQTILIEIISAQVKEIAILLSKLAVEKAILAVKSAQASASGGGFLGSLFKIGASVLGGGGNLTATQGSFAEGGSVRGGMPITVGERGRELFVPETNGTIIPNQDLGGGMNITFNIQANDVRGIKELLIDNRATIINLVNQGANQKGKSNVI